MPRHRDLVIAAAVLALLPFALGAIGLGITSASEVAIFAMACMALNILVGYTGLVSFGHGAWFGLGAYAAAMAQRELFKGSFVLPAAVGVVSVLAIAWVFGFLILRRRGVYFSLLTLALAAMLYTVAFRWTEVTGGENGLGGITRPEVLGIAFENPIAFYCGVAGIAYLALGLLWRFHRSPLGSVLVAIRDNEQRARFLGYPVNRYKLVAFTASAGLAGLAGVLLLFNNRMTSADPISVAFSGELLAMVIIGGMRSFLGPALGALFFVIFRDSLSRATEDWLLYFGLLFVAFVVFSPEGLVGLYNRLTRRWRKEPVLDAAMAQRQAGEVTLPAFLRPSAHVEGVILDVEGLSKSFGGIHAVRGAGFKVRDRTLHALIGPNGAGKTTAFNLISGLFRPDDGHIALAGKPIAGLTPEKTTAAGVGRSFQLTNLFASLTVQENVRLAIQARDPRRFWFWIDVHRMPDVDAKTAEVLRAMGLAGIEGAQAGTLSYGGQRLLDMSLALATGARILLLDEPLAGLAAGERERVGALIKGISRELPVLLVEHDIDRVFALADAVTVMNDGEVLVDGGVAEARDSPRVQEVYIGAGTHALAGRSLEGAARDTVLLSIAAIDAFYGKSHILRNVGFDVHDQEIVALLGRNGAGKSTLLKSVIGIVAPRSGSVKLAGEELARRPSAQIARRGIAYVPQGRGLFAGMSVAHNLELGRLKRRTGMGTSWDEERILAAFPRLKRSEERRVGKECRL